VKNFLEGDAESGDSEPKFNLKFEELGGFDTLESLQNHPNVQVYKNALHILETYFACEEDDVVDGGASGPIAAAAAEN
jgi:hypothetical protein